MTVVSDRKIPNKVFIVPYRNREEQKFFFSKYMSFIMEDFTDYEIYFSHQTDNRSFNRGATKNIGFLAIKEKYPDDYKNITFIFNDVDTIPFTKIFNYETTCGTVKHYYGFKYTLGGIVVIKGEDFERINGFPNYWGWGSEDSCLQKRCEKAEIVIDRSNFFPIGSPQILHLFDGISRIINKKDPIREKNDNGIDGINSIYQLQYEINEKSTNPKDNLYTVDNNKIYIINITHFFTAFDYNNDSKELYNYDLREPKKKILEPNSNRKCDINNAVQSSESWTNIPYYPTCKEKKEMISQGIKPINPYENPNHNFNINDIPVSQIYQHKYPVQKSYTTPLPPPPPPYTHPSYMKPSYVKPVYVKPANIVQPSHSSHSNNIYNYPNYYLHNANAQYQKQPKYTSNFKNVITYQDNEKKTNINNDVSYDNTVVESNNNENNNMDHNMDHNMEHNVDRNMEHNMEHNAEHNVERNDYPVSSETIEKNSETELRKKIREEIELEIYNNQTQYNNTYKSILQNKQPYMNKPANVFSPYYANYMGIKPSASTSGKINFNGFMNGLRKR